MRKSAGQVIARRSRAGHLRSATLDPVATTTARQTSGGRSPNAAIALAAVLATLTFGSPATKAVAAAPSEAVAPAPLTRSHDDAEGRREARRLSDDRSLALTRLAQQAPAASSAKIALRGKPGDNVPLSHALIDMAVSSGNYVIVNRAPAWMSLAPAESIGSGVWLIAPDQLRNARVKLSAAAAGQHEFSIAVVGSGGNPIAEAKMLVDVATANGASPPAAQASPTAQASPASPATAVAAIAAAPLVSPAAAAARPAAANPAPAPEPVAAAAAPTAKPATPAAPAATVAQNTAAPPAKDGTKAWTEFLGGAKPGAAPAATPAARVPSAAPKPAAGPAKSEAELIGYAKHLVRECTTCHSLYGQDIGIPLMVGLAKDRFLDTMELYRIGKRDNVAMASVAQSLSEEETLALALYLGRIKPPAQAASVTRSSIGNAAAAAGSAPSSGPGLAVPAQRIAPDSKDQERISRWLKRGQQMLDSGEISQARLLLTRAAELGDPRAALMLASSYDPNVMPWRPGMGLEAEPARAKELYQLAIRLGAGAEAERRLSDLP